MYFKEIETNKEAKQLKDKAEKANAAERLAKLKKKPKKEDSLPLPDVVRYNLH